jgi:hypothetical protein
MTYRQRELARHALGLPNKKRTTNRNHFFTAQDGKDYDDWCALFAEGSATRRDGPDSMFYLTWAGALGALGPGESISREDAARMAGAPRDTPNAN